MRHGKSCDPYCWCQYLSEDEAHAYNLARETVERLKAEQERDVLLVRLQFAAEALSR